MTEQHPDEPRRTRPHRWPAAALLLALAACVDREPQVSVTDLNWACGARRCTATFRLAAGDTADEDLLVLVRAYAGGVADREIVGEHKERLSLRSGQSRRLSVAIETQRPAERVRVVTQRAR